MPLCAFTLFALGHSEGSHRHALPHNGREKIDEYAGDNDEQVQSPDLSSPLLDGLELDFGLRGVRIGFFPVGHLFFKIIS